MNRRTFLTGAAGIMVAAPGKAGSGQSRTAAARAIRVDGLSAVGGMGFMRQWPLRPAELAATVRAGRVHLFSQTMCEVGNGPDRFRLAVEMIAHADRTVAEHSEVLMKIETPRDILRARDSGRLGMIYNFQDSTPLEGDASRLRLFATLGMRVQQLTYNKRNLAGDGCLEPGNAGLSDFGREVIAEANQLGVLMDFSHAGQRTQAEGIAASRRPPAITHTGCRDLVDLPRNTFDREIRAVADKGGVVGIYLMPFLRRQGQPGPDDFFRHIDHAVRIAGEDHVGIGTDGPILETPSDEVARAEQRAFFEDRARRGIAAPGEAADVLNLVDGYSDADRYERIATDLRRRGWTSTRIDKVLGGNFVRLFTDVWYA